MKLAILTEASTQHVKQSGVSFVGPGIWRVTSSCDKSNLRASCHTADGAKIDVKMNEEFSGPANLTVYIDYAHPDTKRISVYAERVKSA